MEETSKETLNVSENNNENQTQGENLIPSETITISLEQLMVNAKPENETNYFPSKEVSDEIIDNDIELSKAKSTPEQKTYNKQLKKEENEKKRQLKEEQRAKEKQLKKEAKDKLKYPLLPEEIIILKDPIIKYRSWRDSWKKEPELLQNILDRLKKETTDEEINAVFKNKHECFEPITNLLVKDSAAIVKGITLTDEQELEIIKKIKSSDIEDGKKIIRQFCGKGVVWYIKKYNLNNFDTSNNTVMEVLGAKELGAKYFNKNKNGFDLSDELIQGTLIEVKISTLDEEHGNGATFNDTTVPKALSFNHKRVYLATIVVKKDGDISYIVYGNHEKLGDRLLKEAIFQFASGGRRTQRITIKELIDDFNFYIICPSYGTIDGILNLLKKDGIKRERIIKMPSQDFSNKDLNLYIKEQIEHYEKKQNNETKQLEE